MIKPNKHKIIILTIVTVIIMTCSALFVYKNQSRAKIFEMYVFNLKKGQAMLIRTPNDKRVLINGGSNSEIIRHITRVLPFYSRRIDTVIATTDQSQDITGLVSVLDRYEIGRVYTAAVSLGQLMLASSSDPTFLAFTSALKKKGIEPLPLKMGDTFSLDDFSDKHIYARIFFPVTPDQGVSSVSAALPSTTFSYTKTSAPELIMSLEYGDDAVVILGNATAKIQKYIAANLEIRNEPKLVVIVANTNGSDQNFAKSLINRFHPQYLIYAKSLASESRTKKLAPSLYFPESRRFNIKHFQHLKITSDGREGNLRIETKSL